ncbi:hypothetical protein [Cupriavidus sp. a3]|uniref:hypothetical protein n=1 Tax=Cupriavidus sp. a3 TaxID=3242158 RepID=UPI003D9C0EC1
MALLSGNRSALDVHLNGTVGTFRVSSESGESAGVEVRYLLTHVTLSEKQGQTQLLDMLAPVREVFDLKQLGFEEIMQRDIDDARVSLELIPYLLDSSTSGQIKLFPPIVAVVLPLKPNSRVPDEYYRAIQRSDLPSSLHSGHTEHRITAGLSGDEQFEFFQYSKDGNYLSSDGARLSLARDNCALAIVDGQHRAMALLALYRNMKGGWSDARRSPYEGYYQVWPDKEIRAYNLNELQLPVLICTFPELDGSQTKDVDVVRAARRVFLTLNKTAKKVSDSRNKLLNDQDIVAECLRETLSFIKGLGPKDDTGLRIWNVELDQEGDRVKVGSDVAFTGVSHLYHSIEHLLMSTAPVRGIGARGKVGAPRKRLDEAFERLGLKDELTADQKELNTRFNYSDEIAEVFRKKWRNLYVPIVDRVFGKFHPLVAFSRAAIGLNKELTGRRDMVLERMLFDGQATARTFDDFREGLYRRVIDKEPGWTTPELKETLARVDGVVRSRREMVESMKAERANYMLEQLSPQAKKKFIADGHVVKPVREAVDRLYDNVFSTVAFQTALVCTYAEAVQEALGGVDKSTVELLDQYIAALNKLFAPRNAEDLKRLLHTFEGLLEIESEVKLVLGGPTFRQVVLPAELQPAEWPKYRYILIELWETDSEEIKSLIDVERKSGREQIAQALFRRRLRSYCEDERVPEADVDADIKDEILDKSKEMYEEFLSSLIGKKVKLPRSIFEPGVPSASSVDPESGESPDPT